MTTTLDFNNAGPQRSYEIIPSGTILAVHLHVRPGGAGEDGWLRRASTETLGLDCEFTVIEGEHAKRKIWQLYTVHAAPSGHGKGAAEISFKALAAMLESVRGIRPDDKSEAAQKARQPDGGGWGGFDGLRFLVRVGVQPAEGSYPAKNTIFEIITPEQLEWKKIEQLAPDAGKARAGTVPGGVATSPGTPAAVTRPRWAR